MFPKDTERGQCMKWVKDQCFHRKESSQLGVALQTNRLDWFLYHGSIDHLWVEEIVKKFA